MRKISLLTVLFLVSCTGYVGFGSGDGIGVLPEGLCETCRGERQEIIPPEVTEGVLGGVTSFLGPYKAFLPLGLGGLKLLASFFITRRRKRKGL